MVMGACPGQIPMPCVPPTLFPTATMVRACRYKPNYDNNLFPNFDNEISYIHIPLVP